MRYTKYIAILLTFFAVACTTEEFDQPLKNVGNRVKIAARVMPFTDCNVSSRTAKNDKENEVKSLDLIIFGNDLKCVYMTHSSGESVFSIDRGTQKENETVLDNGDFAGISQDNLSECQIYAIANFPELSTSGLGVGDHVTEFMNISTAVSGINIPSTGMPMLGSYVGKVDLRASDEQITEPYEVPMQALYSKIVFNIEVDATQTTANQTPQFMIQGFKVQNVAESVDFYPGTESAKDLNDGNNDETAIIMNGDEPKVFDGVITGSTIATDGGNSISFSFYLPERFLQAATAASQYAYPFGTGANIREEDKELRQRYKPLIAKDEATFVTFTGVYTDHQGHTFDVSYDIYVGNDNYGNFDVVRNHQYNNMITIKGIQNSSDQSIVEGAVSIDHRVTVERTQPVIISLRRETLLDAHFEVRPLRIRANMNHASNQGSSTNENAAIKVEIIYDDSDTQRNWIGLERSYGNGTAVQASETYCVGTGSSAGKRKYFTTNLTTNTLAGNGTFTNGFSTAGGQTVIVPISQAGECVWIYVDECTEEGTSTKDLRSATIRTTYGTINGTTFTAAANQAPIDYIINQHKLFLVQGEKSYHIECEEEYLHNFDADDTFTENQTEDEGMVWGLYNAQLSFDNMALYFDGGNGFFSQLWSWFQNLVTQSLIRPYYDFYIPKHDTSVSNQAVKRAYRGWVFCNEIINDINANASNRATGYDGQIGAIPMDAMPTSAIEYCYNRNKRNPDGSITSVDWYLPAIDEMEDIIVSSYESFDDFHNKYYWSCQPSYIPNYATTTGKTGTYYEDDNGIYQDGDDVETKRNNGYARATKAYYKGDDGNPETIDWDYTKSGTSGYDNLININMGFIGIGASAKMTYTGTYNNSIKLENWDTETMESISREEGNFERSTKHRVRCVRKSQYTNESTTE